jgi:hypothetical protein
MMKSRRRIVSPKAPDHTHNAYNEVITAGIGRWRNGVQSSSRLQPRMSALGHSPPSNFVPVLNNVRYASIATIQGNESELTLWAMSEHPPA